MHPASPTPCSTQPKQKIRSLAGGLPINLVLVFLISWNLNECYGSPEGVGPDSQDAWAGVPNEIKLRNPCRSLVWLIN